MSVDPTDDCTFWYVGEYYDSPTRGPAGNWHIRIGSFSFPQCSQTPAQPDFNNDGYADLAIGVPDESIGTLTSAGAVNVLHGSSSGLGTTGQKLWSQYSPNVRDVSESGDHFGTV
jgi:hypothetical protein